MLFDALDDHQIDAREEYALDAQPVRWCPTCHELMADHQDCLGCGRPMCEQYSTATEKGECLCWRCLEFRDIELLREASRVVFSLRMDMQIFDGRSAVARDLAETFLSRLRDAGVDHQRVVDEALDDALNARMKAAPGTAIPGAADFSGEGL